MSNNKNILFSISTPLCKDLSERLNIFAGNSILQIEKPEQKIILFTINLIKILCQYESELPFEFYSENNYITTTELQI